MIAVIMYPSAAEFWLNAAEGVNFDMFSAEKRKLTDLPEIPDKPLSAADVEQVAKVLSLRAPVDIMVGKDSDKGRCKDCVGHTLPRKIPEKSFIYMGEFQSNGDEKIKVYVSSPEYTFLQAAPRLVGQRTQPLSDLIDLIVLGTELCSIYVHDSKEKFAHKKRRPSVNSEIIREYLKKADGAYGIKRARRAARYILDNSNSPMETKLSLYLTLPPSAGGFGFSKPELNVELKVGDNKVLYGDLGWMKDKVIAEYDSDQTHLDAKQHSIDSERQNLLIAAGYKVVHVTSEIMRDSKKREETFMTLRRYLSIGNRGRMDVFSDRRRMLWRMLSHSQIYDRFIRK